MKPEINDKNVEYGILKVFAYFSCYGYFSNSCEEQRKYELTDILSDVESKAVKPYLELILDAMEMGQSASKRDVAKRLVSR